MVRSFVKHAVTCLLLAAMCVALLAALVAVVMIGPPAAAHASSGVDCTLAARPDASFTVADPAGTFTLTFDLDANSAATVEASRVVARFRAVQAGFGDDAVAAVDAYLDGLLAWYGYLLEPCAPAVPYAGPFATAPEVPGAAYGFGGIDVAVPAMVITITAPLDDGSAGAGTVVDAANAVDDGPALAHSGSESFVLAYFGAGLLAFGATALGMKRWMSGPI